MIPFIIMTLSEFLLFLSLVLAFAFLAAGVPSVRLQEIEGVYGVRWQVTVVMNSGSRLDFIKNLVVR